MEACATIAACLAAFATDPDPVWPTEARRALAWFTGANDLGIPLVDTATGSCRDGLHPDRANENRGAESVLAWLLSLSDMRRLAQMQAQARTGVIPLRQARSAASFPLHPAE